MSTLSSVYTTLPILLVFPLLYGSIYLLILDMFGDKIGFKQTNDRFTLKKGKDIYILEYQVTYNGKNQTIDMGFRRNILEWNHL